MFRFLLGACFLFIFFVFTSVSASEKISIYAIALEYRLREDGNAQYNKLLSRIIELGVEFNLIVRPFKRVFRDFDKHSGCMFPVSLNTIATTAPQYKTLKLIASEAIDRVSLRVFTRTKEEKISKMEQLNGKKIGLWNGFDPKIFLKGIEASVEVTPNEEVRVKMLNAKRIDVILGHIPDVILVAEELGLPLPYYDENLAIYHGEGAAVVCHDNAANRQFISKFNDALMQLKKTGELRNILGPHVDIVN